ncbi:MAG: hypothetical protein LWX83_13270 [Anaerolineae bacterium]|nr:hypothetical protein [Anaerolineae bacterium]
MTEIKNKHDPTGDFLSRLFRTEDISRFIENNAFQMELPEFHVYITDFCKTSGKVPEQVILQASIERTYGHQLFNGTRKPSRDKVIQLAFGLELDVDGTQKLLLIAGKSALYPKIKRDAAIIFCLVNHKNVDETQSVLHSLGLTLLGGR